MFWSNIRPRAVTAFEFLFVLSETKQNQLLVDDLVEREQVIVGAGDEGKVIPKERHQFVQKTLDFGDALPVLERLL